MTEPHANTSPSSALKRRGWQRLFLWGILAGGGILFLFGVFLAAITVPNLRREVAPPEISGPEQVERNAAEDPASPASRSQSVSASTSATQSLQMDPDDFPHLSPKMRELTRSWFERCAETDRLLGAISDPAQRALALAILAKGRENRRALLNLPLRWDDQTFEETDRYLMSWNSSYEPDYQSREGASTRGAFLEAHPEFKNAFEQESARNELFKERMSFEFYVHSRHWDSAVINCTAADLRAPFNRQLCPEGMNSWEEEVYCLRQMGVPGWACLAGRSYQHAFDSRWPDRRHYLLRAPGYLPPAILEKIKEQNNKSS
jgi:hypothetical protein